MSEDSPLLHEHHLRDLRSSGISDEMIKAMGCRSASAAEVKEILGFVAGPGLAFPFPTFGNGENPYIRIKPDQPYKRKNGQVAKYLSPSKSKNTFYTLPVLLTVAGDAKTPLLFVEGEKKAAKATQEGFPAIGLLGVYGWRTRDRGKSRALPDFDRFVWDGRTVMIAYDSDVAEKPEVQIAEERLGEYLRSLGAAVKVLRLPRLGPEGTKTGVDDYLIAQGPDAFRALLSEAKPLPPVASTIMGEVDEIRSLPKAMLPTFRMRRAVAEKVLRDLRREGTLINAGGNYGEYYFCRRTNRVMPLESKDIQVLLRHRYGLNPLEADSKHTWEDLRLATIHEGERAEVYRFARYEPVRNTLYIYDFSGGIYRITPSSIERIANGSDGVLFIHDPRIAPIEIATGSPQDLLKPLIFDKVNFDADFILNPGEQKLVLHTWVYSLFFESILPTKVILAMLGRKGSGKTWGCKAIGKLLFGPEWTVSALRRDKEDAFDAAIFSNYFVAYDNVDGGIDWLNDKLAVTATGHELPLRTLYTTNELKTYRPHCFVALTAREPKFRRDDVCDRLLITRMKRLETFSDERSLLSPIIGQRVALWRELVSDLQRILLTLSLPQGPWKTSHRMADWAALAYRIAQTGGIEKNFECVLDKVVQAQEDFSVEEDVLARVLDQWLEEPANLGRPIVTTDLYREVLSIAESERSLYDISRTSLANSIAFGRHLGTVLPTLNRRFKIIERNRHAGKRELTFIANRAGTPAVPPGEDAGEGR